jgi:hypothetical protein
MVGDSRLAHNAASTAPLSAKEIMMIKAIKFASVPVVNQDRALGVLHEEARFAHHHRRAVQR